MSMVLHMESVQSPVEEHTYEEYMKLGGIINVSDYSSALLRARGKAPSAYGRAQAELMARVAGIPLEEKDALIALYSVLREDENFGHEKYHHSQMSDQQLFAEVLRMRGEAEFLRKFIAAHPHIFQ